MLTLWVVALISISLPSEYTLVSQESETVQREIFQAKNEFRSWQSPSGKTITFSYWEPMPPYDGGPAVFDREWPVVIAGQKTKIAEASMFSGVKQHIFVTYLKFSKPKAMLTIHGKGFTKEEFQALLVKANIHRQ